MRKTLIIIILLLLPTMAFTQSDNWPFKDSNGNVIRGKITGTSSESRTTGPGTVRFHGGTDLKSPYPDGTQNSLVVYSMHNGTAIWNGLTTWGSSYIRVIQDNGKIAYYKHILPDSYDPLADENVVQIPSNTTIPIVKGQFLGLMITTGAIHLHLNENDLSSDAWESDINYLNGFLSPFTDNDGPNFMYPFNSVGAVISNAVSNNVIEYRINGHTHDSLTDLVNETVSDLNGVSRLIVFDKLDMITRARDRHVNPNGDASSGGNNGVNKIYFSISKNNTDIENFDGLNFNETGLNVNALFVFDERSNDGRHVYIITSDVSSVPHDKFFNFRIKDNITETFDLSNREGIDSKFNLNSKFKDGNHEINVTAEDISSFNNSNPNSSEVSQNIVIDNFLPYIKKVTLSDSEGIFYEGEWSLNGSETALEFKQCTYSTNIVTGFNIQVETSETMNNLSMNLAGVTNNLISTNNENTVWELQNPFTGNASLNQTITFTGSDTAGNSLLTDPSNLYYRVSDTSWDSYTANSPTTPSMGSDTIHKINQSPNCSDSCTDNYEPNDTQSQATPLYVFGHDFSWSDSLVDECLDQATADEDWYRINLAHQGELTLTLSSQQISSLFIEWVDDGDIEPSTTINGDKQIVICSNNGPACYDTGLRVYTNQSSNNIIPYTLDIQWSANQSCTSGNQSNTNSATQNSSTITINGNTSVCEGLSNTLSASGASGPFDWFVNGQSVHIGNTFNTQSLNTGQYDLFVIATDDVCSFAETQLNITSGVTANAGSDITIQNGGSTTLQGSGGTSCSWSPTTGLTSPNSCTTSASPSQTTTYTLTVTENGCTDTDTITVTVDGSGGGNPPANDDCSDAITLTSGTSCNYTTGTVEDATPSFGANLCDGCSCTSPDDYDVYYKFTAVATSHTVTVGNYASNFDAVIELRTACSSGSSNYISCYDPTGSPSSVSETWTGLTVGQTYYIRVFEWGYQQSPPNADTFDICVTHQSSNTDGIDLISDITSVSNDNPDSGDTITINYTGSNIGDEPTTTLPTISFYLSTNTTLSGSDDFLNAEAILQTIAVNETVNGDIQVTLPNVADGQYYLVSAIDNIFLIEESNESNNVSFYAIQIGDVVSNGPDLDVRDVDVIPNSNLIPGQETDVEVRIKNIGTEDVGSFEVLVYFDVNGNNAYDGGNEFMGQFTFNALDAGDDETMTVDFDLPINIFSTGTYEVFAIADSTNLINETDEGNNDDDDNVTIGYVYNGVNDDVQVIDETIDINNVNAGNDVYATSNHIYLGNQSDSNVPTLDLGYYLSTDCILSADDVFLDDDSSGLGNDDPIIFEDQTLTIPPATPSGTYYILFVADSENEVVEGALENNNVVCAQITVTNTNGANGDVYITDEVCNPTDVIMGSEIEPYINIHYTGTLTNAELPSVAVYYYLSNDCTLSTDDILVSDESISLGSDLPVNDASDAIELPNNLSPGIYYIIFQADAENVVFETNENNNTACVQFNLLPADANYQDVTFNSPYVAVTEASLGDQVYASIHQNYTGYQADSDISSIRMEYYLSTDCNLSADDYYFTTDVSSLGYDDPSQFEFANLTIPITIGAGDYYILFVADTEDIISENNESNNTACAPITITESTLGIEDNELNTKIKVYPNPVDDLLNINLGEIHTKINIEIFNVLGQKINAFNFKNKQELSINTSSYANGIYFFKIKIDAENTKEFKIIKQ